jgi:hypothetical protein
MAFSAESVAQNIKHIGPILKIAQIANIRPN